MGSTIESAKKHGVNLSVLMACITIVVILLSTLKILSVFGVVYEDTTQKIVYDQKQVDVLQNTHIESAQEDQQAHMVQPGHGVGLERSVNMKHRVEVLEVKVEQTDEAVTKLSIATAQLAEQTKILSEQIRQMR